MYREENAFDLCTDKPKRDYYSSYCMIDFLVDSYWSIILFMFYTLIQTSFFFKKKKKEVRIERCSVDKYIRWKNKMFILFFLVFIYMECFLVNLQVNKYQDFSSKIFKTHRLYQDFKTRPQKNIFFFKCWF